MPPAVVYRLAGASQVKLSAKCEGIPSCAPKTSVEVNVTPLHTAPDHTTRTGRHTTNWRLVSGQVEQRATSRAEQENT